MQLSPDETMFILVKVQPGFAIQTVEHELRARCLAVEVSTRNEFSRKARLYWTSQTGPVALTVEPDKVFRA
jgi:hypothetical protein